MKRLILPIALLVLATIACSRQDATSVFDDIFIDIEPTPYPTSVQVPTYEPTIIETPISPSVARSIEEQIAQSMERATNYKLDVYDIRLIRDNEFGLPLRPDDTLPSVVIVIEFLDESMTAVEQQLFWQATKAGIKTLSGQEGITGFYYFFTHSGQLQSGLWCPEKTLGYSGIIEINECVPWPGVSPLPPEMTRFIGF